MSLDMERQNHAFSITLSCERCLAGTRERRKDVTLAARFSLEGAARGTRGLRDRERRGERLIGAREREREREGGERE